MKNFQHQIAIFALLVLVFPLVGFSQGDPSAEWTSEVNRSHPYISMTKAKLTEAQSLSDLNRHYKPSWVRSYQTVEVFTTYKGKSRKAVGASETLSQEQKDHMLQADAGTTIEVLIHYLPENNLKHNELKQMDFSFIVDPEKGAQFVGGQAALKSYLKQNILDKIPSDRFNNKDIGVVRFTVNEGGEVENPHLFWSYNDEKVDAQIIEAVRNMPCWEPAEYANGTNIKQQFVLTLGNRESCVIHMLNIR